MTPPPTGCCPKCGGTGRTPLPPALAEVATVLQAHGAPLTTCEVQVRLIHAYPEAEIPGLPAVHNRLALLETAGVVQRDKSAGQITRWKYLPTQETPPRISCPTFDAVDGCVKEIVYTVGLWYVLQVTDGSQPPPLAKTWFQAYHHGEPIAYMQADTLDEAVDWLRTVLHLDKREEG